MLNVVEVFLCMYRGVFNYFSLKGEGSNLNHQFQHNLSVMKTYSKRIYVHVSINTS